MKQILIVNANYYDKISKNLLSSSKKLLIRKKTRVKIFNVAGIFEIPVAIKKNIKKFDAFVALGCVIKGKTPHFDFICKSTFDAIMNLSILYNKPIGNGIITAFNIKQAEERCGLGRSNKTNKGLEAAKAVMSIIDNGPKKI
jgi:6,7-dimethyl-8-ribityllumazine synthase|tara:strand:+ start:357 stop:782 length:426 start_codon:yes stop_codon:yes gene_type:complete